MAVHRRLVMCIQSRSVGLGDRPVVTPCEIRDGRRVETTLLGERMSVALFSVDGRTLGARDDEAGDVNYEAFATGPEHSRTAARATS